MRILASLHLAVIVLSSLAIALTAGTLIESLQTTQAARYWVYGAKWFHFLLFVLGINIFAVAISRWPWKKRHIPFLLAHLGILTLLFGSWLTERRGIDGMLRVEEGQSGNIVELNRHRLVITHEEMAEVTRVPWVPPNVQFKPFSVMEKGSEGKFGSNLRVTKMISHATSDLEFMKTDKDGGAPAVELQLKGGPMQISQRYWLFGGDQTLRQVQAGPARIFLLYPPPRTSEELAALEKEVMSSANGPLLLLRPEKKGGLSYRSYSPRAGVRAGEFSEKALQNIAELNTGWNQVRVTVENYYPKAQVLAHYKPSPIQAGAQAPPPAIYIESENEGIWLGLGDRAKFETGGKQFGIAYLPEQVALPFSLFLDAFQISYYPGSLNPKAYSSRVRVIDGEGSRTMPNEGKTGANDPSSTESFLVAMNEPLQAKGFTFYQASYEPGAPRPTVSIFSVNRDPGRWWKYWGSALIVTGIILLFRQKWQQKRRMLAQ